MFKIKNINYKIIGVIVVCLVTIGCLALDFLNHSIVVSKVESTVYAKEYIPSNTTTVYDPTTKTHKINTTPERFYTKVEYKNLTTNINSYKIYINSRIGDKIIVSLYKKYRKSDGEIVRRWIER